MYSSLILLVSLLSVCVVATTKKDGWECKNGFWVQNGVKSTHKCTGKDGKGGKAAKNGCTRSEDPAMPAAYKKTCIAGPPDKGRRCWWTHVPSKVKASAAKVPLIIDMHGGGGCASHQMSLSGFKELSESGNFIVAWPQGYPNNQWGTCGSDCDKAQASQAGKKDITKTDDLTFLSNMVAYMVKSQSASNTAKGKIDPERVYATGFSMGCMMSQRFAMERSKIVAGFGCHGGTLIAIGSDLLAQKKRFDIQPMPAYLTGGTQDAWFKMARSAFNAWAFWGNCNKTTTTTAVTLTKAANTSGTKAKSGPPSKAVLGIRSGPTVQVAFLNLTGGHHVMDQRMAKYTWDFLKTYKRSGALAAMPNTPQAVLDPVSVAAGGGIQLAPAAVVALCVAHWLRLP